MKFMILVSLFIGVAQAQSDFERGYYAGIQSCESTMIKCSWKQSGTRWSIEAKGRNEMRAKKAFMEKCLDSKEIDTSACTSIANAAKCEEVAL